MFKAKVDVDNKIRRILKLSDAAQIRWLFRFGASSTRQAKGSIKNAPKKAKTRYGRTRTIKRGKNAGKQRFERGRHSRPGEPPFSTYRGLAGIRNIRFEVDKSAKTVTFGPIRLPRSSFLEKIPAVLESGGTVTREINGRNRQVKIAARPFVKPAAQHGIKRIRQIIAENKIGKQ